MLKLLLAEDEALERRYLKQVIQESQLPLEIVAEAEDGDRAVELSREVAPDILLMDVKMPGMDGLSATRLIKRELPSTSVIVISAYEEFSFAWEALKLGACEYLLKPVAKEEVLSALQVALARQKTESSSPCPGRTAQAEPPDLPHLEAGFVWDLLSGRAGQDQTESRQRLLGVSLQPSAAMVVEAPQASPASSPREVLSLLVAPSLRTAWEEELRAFSHCLKAWIGENRMAVIAAGGCPEDPDAPRQTITEIQQRLDQRFGPLCFGIGETVSDAEDLAYSFAQALEDLDAFCRQSPGLRPEGTASKATSYLEEHFDQPLTLEEVARQVHVSPFHLSRLLKQQTGCTFLEHLIRLRISQAKILLRSTDHPVKTIARQVGFSEPGYFSKVFRKCEGVSPSHYRRFFSRSLRA